MNADFFLYALILTIQTLSFLPTAIADIQEWLTFIFYPLPKYTEWANNKTTKLIAHAFVPAGKNTLRTTRIFCGKAFITYLSGGKTTNRENGAAYIARSVTVQHLMWRDSSWYVDHPSPHYYAPRWAVTRREFTLALAHKACLLVRRSGSQRHLIMAIAHDTHAIAHSTALHIGRS